MIWIDSDTYYKTKSTDLIDLKCDNCSKIYKKEKRSWYYTAYKTKIGLDFKTKTYCSDICRNTRYGIDRKQYNCLFCNKKFIRKIKENPKFCNRSCSAKYNNKKRDGNKFTNCKDCNIKFSVWKCREQKYFRCKSCINKRNIKIKEKKLLNDNKPKEKILINTICKYCSTPFSSYIKNKIFCNIKCGKKYNLKKFNHICKKCNKEFISNKYNSIYCSGSCRSTNLKLCEYAHKKSGKSRSKIEFYLEEKLLKDFPDLNFKFNDTNAIGSELDIFIPELNLAIELNGIVHYEPIYGEKTLTRTQNNDKRKMINCFSLGIELIVINMGKKGLSKFQRDEIYNEIYNIIDNNRKRIKNFN